MSEQKQNVVAVLRQAMEKVQAAYEIAHVSPSPRLKILLMTAASLLEETAIPEVEKLQADQDRLDWLLLDGKPDGFGDIEIWDLIPDCADETDPDGEYLKAARKAIDAVRAQEPRQ